MSPQDLNQIATDEDLDEAIAYEGLIPLAWRARATALGEPELMAISEADQALLDAIMVMDLPSKLDSEERDSVQLDLHRLDAKVDLLLGMINRLLAFHEPPRQPVPVRLSSRMVRWQGGVAPAAGEQGILDVFVHPLASAPLQLPVEITGAGVARILALNVGARNAFEKFLFRQHRRQVAEARQGRE